MARTQRKESIADLTVKPSEAAALVREALRMDQPILLVGPPGCGKSEIAEATARSEGYAVHVAHPVVEDPTYATGLPWPKDGLVEFHLFGLMHELVNATVPTVGFLDDLGQASAATQASYMRPLLARELASGARLPACVRWMGATNRRADSSGVLSILRAVANRMAVIHVRTDVDDWTNIMLDRQRDPRVVGFVAANPGALYEEPASSDVCAFPTPRSWERSAIAAETITNESTRTGMIAGLVGAGRALELAAFLRLADGELPSWDDVLRAPRTAPATFAEERRDLYYCVAAMLAGRMDATNVDRVYPYVERLPIEYRAVAMMGAYRRNPDNFFGTASGRAFAVAQQAIVQRAGEVR